MMQSTDVIPCMADEQRSHNKIFNLLHGSISSSLQAIFAKQRSLTLLRYTCTTIDNEAAPNHEAAEGSHPLQTCTRIEYSRSEKRAESKDLTMGVEPTN